MFIFDWSVLMIPQKATMDSMRTLTLFVSYRLLSPQFSFNFLCLLLLFVSISMVRTLLQLVGKKFSFAIFKGTLLW